MLNFNILKKVQGKVAPPSFVYDFSIKMFPLLYAVNQPNLIALHLEILCNMFVFQVGRHEF